VRQGSVGTQGLFRALDILFATAFTFELLVRLLALGCGFFAPGPNQKWNMFDATVVVFAVVEEGVKGVWSGVPDLTAFRVVRVLRLLRVARVVRVLRFCDELRVMVAGITHSLRSLFWAGLMLFIMEFMFAIVLLDFVSAELEVDDSDMKEKLLYDWGSLTQALYTLYQTISGGISWAEVAQPLVYISPMLGFLFCLYIALAVFCVLNIITGVLVENTKSMIAKDETTVILDSIDKKNQWLDEVRTLWNTLAYTTSGDGDGEVDLETFVEAVEDVRIQALFRSLEIEIETQSVPNLFSMLDFTGNGRLGFDEFAMGIQMIHGQAKSIDMARLRHLVIRLGSRMDKLTESCAKLQAAQSTRTLPQPHKPGPAPRRAPAPPSAPAAELLPGTVQEVA